MNKRTSDPFAEVKIDLAAIVVVAVIGVPLALWLLDGAAPYILFGGYGVGAAVWIHCRVRGVFAAAHASREERRNGPQQQ